MVGKLYGIGVGPGDPELMTVKALKAVEKCNVIATPITKGEKRLAFDIASQICDMEGKEVIDLEFLMTRDQDLLRKSHEKVAKQIEEHLQKGEDVAMLNLGDVSVFSTYSYIMDLLLEKGYEAEVIPGITSFCAVAATLKESLTTMQKPLHIFPAGNLEEIISQEGTKVIMKTGSAMKQVKEILRKQEHQQIVKAISNCGLPTEVVCNSLEEIPEDASYFTTIIVKEKV